MHRVRYIINMWRTLQSHWWQVTLVDIDLRPFHAVFDSLTALVKFTFDSYSEAYLRMERARHHLCWTMTQKQ